MPWLRIPFRLVAAVIAAISFLVLFSRNRPLGTNRGVEPLLFTSGLTQPRGLAFGPEGDLYVVEAGLSLPSGGVEAPGRVLIVRGDRQFEQVAAGLPAAAAAEPLFAQSGPAAVALTGTGAAAALYAFLGPSPEAQLGTAFQVVTANDGPELRPVGELESSVLGPGEAPAARAALWGAAGGADGLIYGTLPAANRLIRLAPAADPGGSSATSTEGAGLAAAAVTGFVGAGQSNPYPAGAAPLPNRAVTVALFGTEPFRPGGGRIAVVQPDGRWQVVHERLSFPIALAFGSGEQLLVLEFASGYDSRLGRFTPRSGRLLVVGPGPGRRRVVVREINYPTALAVAPNGDVFVTENGAFSGVGEGRILRIPGQTLSGL